MKCMAALILLLLPLMSGYGSGHLILYRMGEKDPAQWDQIRKYFGGKGYRVNVYDGSDNLDQHIEMVNHINREVNAVFLALEFNAGEKTRAFVAVTEANKGKGRILGIGEVPARHIDTSRELALAMGTAFSTKVKQFPLFPLLGVDMPGLFLRIECTKGDMPAMLDKIHESLQKYFKRGTEHEG
jgi:hypothetical protein